MTRQHQERQRKPTGWCNGIVCPGYSRAWDVPPGLLHIHGHVNTNESGYGRVERTARRQTICFAWCSGLEVSSGSESLGSHESTVVSASPDRPQPAATLIHRENGPHMAVYAISPANLHANTAPLSVPLITCLTAHGPGFLGHRYVENEHPLTCLLGFDSICTRL